MEAFTKQFDVSIKVFFPYRTKTISSEDSKRIATTTDLKYKTQNNIEIPSNVIFEETPEIKTTTEKVIESRERLVKLIDDFKTLIEKAEARSKDFSLKYNLEDPQQEHIANAERAIFGKATGNIGFSKYQDVLDFEVILNKIIKERTIENGGALNAVA